MAVKIIYEDKDILVCEKPAGLAVQSARISEPDMVSELKNYLTGKQPAGAPGKSAEISAFGGTRQPASATTSVGVRKPQSVYLGVVPGSTSRFPVFWFLPKIKKPQVR